MDKNLEIIKKIASDAFKEKGVKIYLFGSRAKDNFYQTSDIDIAVEGAFLRLKEFEKAIQSLEKILKET